MRYLMVRERSCPYFEDENKRNGVLLPADGCLLQKALDGFTHIQMDL